MRLLFSGFFVGLCFSTQISANVGFFSGSGHTIELTETADIQLVSEEVTMEFMRSAPPYDLGWGSEVFVQCSFVLENLTEEQAQFQVGFPLKSDQVRHANIAHALREEALPEPERSYRFEVQEGSERYEIEYVAHDKEKRYQGVFLWQMDMVPREICTLLVQYSLPVSVELYNVYVDSTDTVDEGEAITEADHNKIRHRRIGTGAIESFRYVTETANSWSGPIEKATFTAHIDKYMEFLTTGGSETDQPEKPENPSELLATLRPMVFGQFSPADWQEFGEAIVWQYEGSVPEEGIELKFITTPIPGDIKDVGGMVQYLGKYYSPEYDKVTLGDFREVVAASFGIRPSEKRVREIISQQDWWTPVPDLTTDDLTPDQQSILGILDELIKE